MYKEVPEAPHLPEESDVLTEEQKKELGELQLFRNKEGSVSIEASLRLLDPFIALNSYMSAHYLLFLLLW